MTKKVLIAAIHHWKSPYQVGTHAIAKQFLARGWEVAYISAPITPFHFLREYDDDLDLRLQNHRSGGEHDYDGKLWHYVPFSLIAPDNRPVFSSEFFLKKWHLFGFPNLLKLINAKHFGSVNLLFIDSIYQSFLLNQIDYELSAFRIADNNKGFKGYSKAAGEVESYLIQKVDKVFVSAKSMKKPIEDMNPRSVDILLNGVEVTRFRTPLPAPPNEYTHLEGPIVIYVGAFGEWFDFDLVQASALQLPKLNFVLIGPANEQILKLSNTHNIHFLGPKKYEEIPTYLRHANLGIIPFDVTNHRELVSHINPLKLYEYIAGDLPVVVTMWKELENLTLDFHRAYDNETFIEEIKSTIESRNPADKTIQNIERFDWNKTTEVLFQWLDQ